MGPLCVGCSRLSGMWRRRKKAMGINARPSKKGYANPTPASAPSLSASVSTMPTTPAASDAMPWLASCQLPYRPRRPWGAISIRYVVDGPTRRPGPAPLHQPTGNDDDGCRQPDACVRGGERHADRADRDERNGQQHGRLASDTIGKRADQQPAQRGRVMKPTPKTATDSITVTSGSSAGKKVWPIYTAKNA